MSVPNHDWKMMTGIPICTKCGQGEGGAKTSIYCPGTDGTVDVKWPETTVAEMAGRLREKIVLEGELPARKVFVPLQGFQEPQAAIVQLDGSADSDGKGPIIVGSDGSSWSMDVHLPDDRTVNIRGLDETDAARLHAWLGHWLRKVAAK